MILIGRVGRLRQFSAVCNLFPETLEEIDYCINDILECKGELIHSAAVFKQLRRIESIGLIRIGIILIEGDYAEASVLIVI